MKSLLITLLLAGVTTISGCQDDNSQTTEDAVSAAQSSEQAKLDDNAKGEDMISVSGKIEYKAFEGGFFAFIANDGRHFTPQGLPQEYLQDGLEITLTGTPMPNIMTTTQFGVVFKVDSVSDVDHTKISENPVKPVKPSEL